MAMYVRILNESSIRLWGLSSRERLEKMLTKAGMSSYYEHGQAAGDQDSVLLLRGDYLYDQRIIQNLIVNDGTVLEINTPQGPMPVAAHVSGAQADQLESLLSSSEGPYEVPEGLRKETPESLASAYLKDLRKFDVPYLLPISEKTRRSLEKRLFSGSYKGVTDLVTKWLWPVPAQWGTKFCTLYGIVPNQVTSLSLILSILACIMFYQGYYAVGLVMAWFMTFLDTVDGKLARCTLNYSAFGNIFDHAIDLIFPPIWYLAWGVSLTSVPGLPLHFVLWMVIIGYVAGRLVELIFKQFLESSGIFCWQPIDSVFRLITGRRNPNLVLLTLCLCLGRPDVGILVVSLWTALSSLFLATRLVLGFKTRLQSGPLRSWFLDVDPADENLSVFQRWFCPRPKLGNAPND